MTAIFRNFLLLSLLSLPSIVLAGGPVQVDTDMSGIAIKGHDPVAYFTENKAVMGNADHTATHNGATYHFASTANRDAFQADPDKYAPQYGGYCAYGTTLQKKVPGDPQAFKVVDGKLYINSGPKAHELWGKDISGHISKADGIWPGIIDKNPADL